MYEQTNYRYKGYGSNQYSILTRVTPIKTIDERIPLERFFDVKTLEGRIVEDNPEIRRQAVLKVLKELTAEIDKYVQN